MSLTRDIEASILVGVVMLWARVFRKLLSDKEGWSSDSQCDGANAVNNTGELRPQSVGEISRSDAQPDPRPHLLNLPQEILDMIFDYVYPPLDTFKTINKYSWEHNEKNYRMNRGRDYQIRPFPLPKVHEFLVCK